MERIISINTLAYLGYDLATALKEISQLGARYVEPAFTAGYSEGIKEEDFSKRHAHALREMISDNGLNVIALAAHMDLGTKHSVSAFERRMDFARELGARIIHANASQQTNESYFFSNLEQLASFAESIGLIIALENPGDGENQIIHSGESGASVVRKIGSEFIRLNYDICNTFSYSKGKIRPEDDIKYALPFAVHFHLKDMRPRKGGWSSSEIGRGVINYSEILLLLAKEPHLPPLGIELPLKLQRDTHFNPKIKQSPVELSEIRKILINSLEFVEKILGPQGIEASHSH